MNAETVFKKPQSAEPSPSLTPRQAWIAATVADAAAVKARWGTLVNEAHTVWRKLQIEELVKVQGNFQGLTELVSARYKLSHESAERQVKLFFDKHFGPVGASLRPK